MKFLPLLAGTPRGDIMASGAATAVLSGTTEEIPAPIFIQFRRQAFHEPPPIVFVLVLENVKTVQGPWA